jgi:acetyl esterase/lipase
MADPALQRALLKRLLSLPHPLLRAASGGGVVWRAGRTLDPRFQFLWKSWRKPRALDGLSPEEARTAWAEMVRATGPRPRKGVEIEALLLKGPAGTIPARLYRPKDQDIDAPMLVFFHDGAGVVGDLDTCEGLCAELADAARCPVLAPAYRLAPEHRFPAGLDDALAAWRWAEANAARYGAQGAAVGGQSMGAAFAAAICQTLREAGEEQPALQLLICPLLDAASDAQSLETFADAWPLSREALRWALAQYIGPEDDPTDPGLSPLRAASVSGLALAIIITAGFDPLVDQGEQYARKLRAAKVATVYRCYERLPHAFTAFAGVAPSAAVAVREIAGLLREGFEGRVPATAAQARADGLTDRGEAFGLQQRRQFTPDASDQPRPAEHHGAVELHRRGARANLGQGVGARGHAPRPDQRQSPGAAGGEIGQHQGRGLEQRRARQASGLAAMRRAETVRPGDGGVRHDQGVYAMRQRRLDDVLDLAGFEVRRHLQEHRLGCGLRRHHAPRLGQAAQELVQRRAALQGAQARRVGRGDIDREIVRQTPQPPEPRHIVGDAILGVLVGPDVGPDHARPAAPVRQALGEGLHPSVVEAHAVDDRAIPTQPEQPRLGIAGLRQGRDRAAFHEAEPGFEHRIGDLGVFVEARRQTDAVGQLQPGDLGRQHGVAAAGRMRSQPGLQGLDGQAVCALRIEPAQRRGGQAMQAHSPAPPP